MTTTYKNNLEVVDFFKRVQKYNGFLEVLRENIVDVIDMRDKKKMTFEDIAKELELSSKSAAYLIYKANKGNLTKIRKYKIK